MKKVSFSSVVVVVFVVALFVVAAFAFRASLLTATEQPYTEFMKYAYLQLAIGILSTICGCVVGFEYRDFLRDQEDAE